MAFDFKKEYKEFYMPKNKPGIVSVPSMNYIAVRGQGDPNAENGEYKQSIGLLYGIAFTIKMSKKGEHQIDGYFDYVVPPLEGFWWQDGMVGIDYAHKEDLKWISAIRLPDFVTREDFVWAVEEAAKKKKTDFSKVEFLTYYEGTCVQCMHIGSYDDEPATVALMHDYMESHGYILDITENRLHHEIYLSDARKVSPEKLKTVIRHPIRKMLASDQRSEGEPRRRHSLQRSWIRMIFEYDLSRFIDAHQRAYERALAEIRGGYKASHWMWYIFPQIQGLGRSGSARYYAIRDIDEARAFISHPYLGGNLREISEALLQLDSNDPVAVMGWPDDLKLRSCMTLFANACEDNELFLKVLDKYYGGLQDSETLNILRSQAEGAER